MSDSEDKTPPLTPRVPVLSPSESPTPASDPSPTTTCLTTSSSSIASTTHRQSHNAHDTNNSTIEANQPSNPSKLSSRQARLNRSQSVGSLKLKRDNGSRSPTPNAQSQIISNTTPASVAASSNTASHPSAAPSPAPSSTAPSSVPSTSTVNTPATTDQLQKRSLASDKTTSRPPPSPNTRSIQPSPPPTQKQFTRSQSVGNIRFGRVSARSNTTNNLQVSSPKNVDNVRRSSSPNNNPNEKFRSRSSSSGNIPRVEPTTGESKRRGSTPEYFGRSRDWKRRGSINVNQKKPSQKSPSTDSLASLGLNTIEEKEKQELKSKVSELEEYKTKYEDEKKENQILKNRLAELMMGQNDTTQSLMRANDSLDRLRLDQKKKIEQIEKMQSDINFKNDRIRNLEIRASEVDKADLILESTKQNLESTVQQVRVRENEIRKLEKDLEDVNRKLEIANHCIGDLEGKVHDLKLQVRHELMKNDEIEKNLETIPRLKDTIKEKEEEITDLNHQLEDKTALLQAARRAVREYKDKLRMTETEISKTETLKEDLQLSQYEISTLKKLMYGKDYLVSQKSKALDLSKEIIEVLNDSGDNDHMSRIKRLLDRISTSQPPNSVSSSYGSLCSPTESSTGRYRSSTPNSGHHPNRDISVNNNPYTLEQDGNHGNHQKQVFLSTVMGDMKGKRKRPVSAMCKPVNKSSLHRTSSLKEAQKVYTSPLPRKDNPEIVVLSSRKPSAYKSERPTDSKYRPSLDYSIGAVEDEQLDMDNIPHENGTSKGDHSVSDGDSECSDYSDLEDEEVTEEMETALKRLSAREKDEALKEIIAVGDRILISCQQKPPRYGKKRVLKPINLTGIVKFVGKFDNEKFDARVQAGIRMDEPVGDTDGMYKGKRYMYTPFDQGKFFKLREITSVLNIKTGRYMPVRRLLIHKLHVERCRSGRHRSADNKH